MLSVRQLSILPSRSIPFCHLCSTRWHILLPLHRPASLARSPAPARPRRDQGGPQSVLRCLCLVRSRLSGGRREIAPRQPHCTVPQRQLPARSAVRSGIDSSSLLFASLTARERAKTLELSAPRGRVCPDQPKGLLENGLRTLKSAWKGTQPADRLLILTKTLAPRQAAPYQTVRMRPSSPKATLLWVDLPSTYGSPVRPRRPREPCQRALAQIDLPQLSNN
jgi:hypothetical protein